MSLENELQSLRDHLAQQRDDIELRMHLAGMEIKQLWQESEPKWERFIDQLGIADDESKETSAELLHATKAIGDELKDIYRRIVARLGE